MINKPADAGLQNAPPVLIALPFDDAWPVVAENLARHRNLVLVAEPGAGKTTRLPPMLIDGGIVAAGARVAVLEPRRLAARAAATRISSERSWPLKSKVGYNVRFDRQMTDETKLVFYTEGLFLKHMAQNSRLTGIDCVVIDEFHERNRFTDIAIAALKELQFLERPDLRIIVMSATIDAERIANYIAIDDQPAPIVRVPGRTYPVEIHHANEPLRLKTDRDWTQRVANRIRDVERIGDVLVFFPGVGEIRRTREILDSDRTFSRQFDVLELHGSLTLDEQTQVLTRSLTGRPRVILATNIAETSLTIDGVGTVIDTGLARVTRADKLGFSQLHLERISMASVTQRAGRAGRQAPGLCYRLWSKLDENSFASYSEAELKRVDLADSLLELYSLGVTDPRQFDWFERPEPLRLEQSLSVLKDLGAVDQDARITAVGKQMSQISLPARCGRMMVAASPENESVRALATVLACLLSEKDFVLDGRSESTSIHECDLYARAAMMLQRSGRVDATALATVKRVIATYTKESIEEIVQRWDEKLVAQLLLAGFPDRVCRRRNAGSAQGRMVGKRGVELHPGSGVRQAELFFALRGDAGVSRATGDPLVTMASMIKREWLQQFAPDECSRQAVNIFDIENLTVYAAQALVYRDLPLESGARGKPNPDEAFEQLKNAVKERRERIFLEPPIASFAARLKSILKESPGVDAELFDRTFEIAVDESIFGQTSIRFLFGEDGAQALTRAWERAVAAMNPALAERLLSHAPSHFTAPTGNRFQIAYPENQPPFVEVRLQELFGLTTHPRVAGQALTFHLLGPNYRPVQVTADLPGFWKGSYFEVRKELRARYPKHSWPEDPQSAKPEAKGHRRPY